MTRILVASASGVVRAGLESILRAHASFEVVASVPGIMDLAEGIERNQPDVVLVDLERGYDGLAPGPLGFAGDSGSPGLVLLVDDPDNADIASMLRAGVRAILSRDAAPEEIVAAVDAAAAGLVTLYSDAAAALVAALPAASRVSADTVEALTPREIEVLAMLAEGEGNKGIARRMGISEHTVKFHVGSILAKLHASSRTEAVTMGVRQGLIMV